ncbi:MAG: redoxin domain-containing protein [Gemmatimonas sp.]|nr:redoxin domain-containing protein [Gemmatimonas sp.]
MQPTIRAILAVLLLGGCQERTEPEEPLALPGTEIGQQAPVLRGQLPSGDSLRVDSPPGNPTVLVFYRSIECGLCRVQLEQMQDNKAAYDRADAALVAVTLDPPNLSRAWIDDVSLDFPLVSVDSVTFRTWGAISAERAVPRPATYVLDGLGIVRFKHVGRNASDRTTDAEVIAILESVRGT